MKKMTKSLVMSLTAILLTNCAVQAQIEMISNGNVAVGDHWTPPVKEFEVHGEMFISHVPKNGVSGWNYVGSFFTNHSYLFNGATVYRPIFQPQWGNNFWIGNAANPFWRVYSNQVYASGVMLTSDERLKENFKPVSASLDRILRLQPFYFDYKFTATEQMDEIMKEEVKESYQNHVGFKAQDLLEDFPKLVKYDENADRYSVNYIGLIPEMVAAMKEQNQVIEELRAELAMVKGNCCNNVAPKLIKQGDISTGGDISFGGASTLEQNQPNPFHQETKINYFLAEGTTQAELYVYDMNGKQIDKFELKDKGSQSITIHKNRLNAGMYYYSLIVDGAEIATKKMILTE